MPKSSDTCKNIVFMPIKPEFAFKILTGKKKFEFRKRGLLDSAVTLVIYASSPVKCVIGTARIVAVHSDSPRATWRTTKHVSGIDRKRFLEYFQGRERAYAIELDDIRPLKRAIAPKEVEEDFIVPQSFRYVDEEFLSRLYRLSKEKAYGEQTNDNICGWNSRGWEVQDVR